MQWHDLNRHPAACLFGSCVPKSHALLHLLGQRLKQRLFGRSILPSNFATDFHRRRKQRGRLAPDDLDIGFLSCIQIAGGCQLQHLTFGNSGRRVSQNIQKDRANR